MADLFVDYGSLPAKERNTLRLLFLYEPYRTLIIDWEHMARLMLETFRAARAAAKDKGPFDDLVEEREGSEEFRAWWPDNEVRVFSEGRKRLRHPRLGVVDLSYVALTPEGRPGLSLVTYVPTPLSDAEDDF